MGPRATVVVLVLVGLLAGCSQVLHDPIEVANPAGVLDLRGWDFQRQGPAVPEGWLWDQGLWSPESGGRPDSIPPAQDSGPPSRGGLLSQLLQADRERSLPRRVVSATAQLRVLTSPRMNYGLRIGALPGALIVWVNGVRVWETGVVSPDHLLFRPDGMGTLVTVQPHAEVLDIVVQMQTDDPLVRHKEFNRTWSLGPGTLMLAENGAEQTWRALQTSILLTGVLLFFWISRLRPERRPLVYFVVFLLSCLAKMLLNVEEIRPMLATLLPLLPLDLFLFVNHGLNLLPFPLMILFLLKQFPQDVGQRSLLFVVWLTAIVTVWELLPFIALSLGQEGWYGAIMGAHWSLFLNLYVVLVTLFIFERFYLVFQRKRSLSKALFLGGLFMGLIVLVPIPLSYFLPIKFVYFLGWGLFLFLLVLSIEVVRDQVASTRASIADLGQQLEKKRELSHFIDPQWPDRLDRTSVDQLRPGDQRSDEAIVVELHWATPAASAIKAAASLAAQRGALLVEYQADSCLWVLHSWPEAALSLCLSLRSVLGAEAGGGIRLSLTKAIVNYQVVEAGPVWLPQVSDIPRSRLRELEAMAKEHGVAVVLDETLQDGLVVGGWKRHRRFSAQGSAIELYEGEDETLAVLKDQSLMDFESALALARSGAMIEATAAMLLVVQANPFDQAARTLLTQWSEKQRS